MLFPSIPATSWSEIYLALTILVIAITWLCTRDFAPRAASLVLLVEWVVKNLPYELGVFGTVPNTVWSAGMALLCYALYYIGKQKQIAQTWVFGWLTLFTVAGFAVHALQSTLQLHPYFYGLSLNVLFACKLPAPVFAGVRARRGVGATRRKV